MIPETSHRSIRLWTIAPQASILFIASAVAWLFVARQSAGTTGGTAGMELPAFTGMWALMMAAMMFPAVAPLASMYVRSIRTYRVARIISFGAGYILVWAAAGLPAFALARVIENTIDMHPGWAKGFAFVAYGLCGVYQLTPLKDVCLRHCRSPIGHLLKLGSYKGPLRDARAGISHGAWCLACCWGLMVVLFALGVMNLAAMIVLALVITAEKLVPWPVGLSRVVGVTAIALAVASLWFPSLAPALTHPAMGTMKM